MAKVMLNVEWLLHCEKIVQELKRESELAALLTAKDGAHQFTEIWWAIQRKILLFLNSVLNNK